MKMKILIVDDELLVRIVTKKYLEDAGHQVIVAADGEGAIKMLEEQKPDMVITDHQMSGSAGGLEVLHAAQRLNIRRCMMSGHFQDDLAQTARMLGAEKLILKDEKLADELKNIK